MFAIAVLFFLMVWVFIILFAMRIGSNILKKRMSKPYAGKLGGFLGFMLTIGGFMVYWAIEYVQIQRTITHLCETEGGITVYVTPEEWREQIGEDEWAKLVPFTDSEIYNNGDPKITEINHQNRIYQYTEGRYRSGNIENLKVALYIHTAQNKHKIREFSNILANRENGNILAEKRYFFYTQPAVANNLSGLKLWLDNIESCDVYDKKFHDLAIQYSNLTKGEKDEK